MAGVRRGVQKGRSESGPQGAAALRYTEVRDVTGPVTGLVE